MSSKIIKIAAVIVVMNVVGWVILNGVSGKTSYIDAVAKLAASTGNAFVCDVFLNSQITWNPEDTCRAKAAVLSDDIRLCQKSDYWEWPCFSYYFREKTTADISICREVPDESVFKTACKSGTVNGITTVCSEQRTWRDECYQMQASTVSDPTICAEIQSGEIKNNCYAQVAKKKQ